MSIVIGLHDSIAAGWRLLSVAITAGAFAALGAIVIALAVREVTSAKSRMRFQ